MNGFLKFALGVAVLGVVGLVMGVAQLILIVRSAKQRHNMEQRHRQRMQQLEVDRIELRLRVAATDDRAEKLRLVEEFASKHLNSTRP